MSADLRSVCASTLLCVLACVGCSWKDLGFATILRPKCKKSPFSMKSQLRGDYLCLSLYLCKVLSFVSAPTRLHVESPHRDGRDADSVVGAVGASSRATTAELRRWEQSGFYAWRSDLTVDRPKNSPIFSGLDSRSIKNCYCWLPFRFTYRYGCHSSSLVGRTC